MIVKNVIYVTSALPEIRETQMIQSDGSRASIQAFKYHRLLCEGLGINGMNVTVVTYNRYNSSIGLFDGMEESVGTVKYHYIVPPKCRAGGYLHLFFKTYREVIKRIDKDTVIVCDALNATISYAALCAAKRKKIESVAIVTDFPDMSRKSLNGKISWRIIKKCSKWILLTNQMYDYLGRKKKAVVLEGHVDQNMVCRDNNIVEKYYPKRCIYAGSLKKKYGITKLIQAFKNAEILDAELHIYGSGEIENELRNMNETHIKYHGVVPNSIVVNDEIHATLLINPRPTDGEYTKYSFPSKNLEYMASGTPILTTRLSGMPLDYNDYVYFFDDESVEGMAKTLKNILSKPTEELHQKGIAAKKFVIDNKSNVAQSKKVIDLLNS